MQFTKPSYNWTPGGLANLLKKEVVSEPKEITQQLGPIFCLFWEVTPASNVNEWDYLGFAPSPALKKSQFNTATLNKDEVYQQIHSEKWK